MFRNFTNSELRSYIAAIPGKTKGQRIVKAAAIRALTDQERLKANEERLNILYGNVLDIYGVPQDFELLRMYGRKIFDKRTRLYKTATAIRRQQLIEEYGIEA